MMRALEDRILLLLGGLIGLQPNRMQIIGRRNGYVGILRKERNGETTNNKMRTTPNYSITYFVNNTL